MHELSAIKAEVTTITPPVFVYDNANHNAQTLDGKDTIHVAAGIAALHPPSALGTDSPVPKLAKLPRAPEVASYGNVTLKEYNDSGTSLKFAYMKMLRNIHLATLSQDYHQYTRLTCGVSI